MINFILMLLSVILSPLLIICAFISVILIACIIIAIASLIAESIRKLVEYIKEDK